MSDEFGRYRLAEKIGEGSLVEVYRAHSVDGSTVALKRLSRAHLENPELATVFASETRIAGVMQGPGLLGALDSGDVDGWPFLVVPLAPGGTLAEMLDDKPALDRPHLRRLALELEAALTAMHGLGYVHGDLSPGNVLFAADGSALLGDFSASTEHGTRQPQPQGTFSYMSPEQVRGDALDVGSDVFSLAALLWQCTSGQRVFYREAQHLRFMAVVEADPPPMPTEFAALEAVLRHALSKDPAGRPGSVREFCSAFADLLG